MKKNIISAICLFIMVAALQSCEKHKNENLSNMFVGVWEISSKDDVDEDGISLEKILDLKKGNVFTEQYTYHKEGEVIAQVSVEGEYGVEKTSGIDGYKSYGRYNTLWRKYNVDSMEKVINNDAGKIAAMLEEFFINENNKLEDARKKGLVYGLVNVKNDDYFILSWDTDEPINENYPDIKKSMKARRLKQENSIK